MHKKSIVILILFILFGLVAAANAELEIHYLDVGQGDSTILLCDGKVLMIDGGLPEYSQFIYSYLHNTLSIGHIDYMISTHPHNDHSGGLSAALNACTVGIVYSPVFYYEDLGFMTLRRVLESNNQNFTIPLPGNEIQLGEATVQFLAPRKLHSKMNDNSIVVKVVYGETSFLFMGDAELEEEFELIESGYDLNATVLRIGHHGSNSSSSDAFLEHVTPEYAVISVGADNTYGHPNQEVLSLLNSMGVKVYRTDQNGTVICTSDGTDVFFAAEKEIYVSGLMEITPYISDEYTDRAAITDNDMTASKLLQNLAGPAVEEAPYIGNKKSMKFHYPDCQGAINMNETNRVELYSREDAIGLGYEPCGTCKP